MRGSEYPNSRFKRLQCFRFLQYLRKSFVVLFSPFSFLSSMRRWSAIAAVSPMQLWLWAEQIPLGFLAELSKKGGGEEKTESKNLHRGKKGSSPLEKWSKQGGRKLGQTRVKGVLSLRMSHCTTGFTGNEVIRNAFLEKVL